MSSGWHVVKYGGSLGEAALKGFAADVATLARQGLRLLVVHGGGPEVSRWSERLGLEPRWLGGLRVTDAETLALAEMVLAGRVSKALSAAITAAGVPALGLSALDAGLIEAVPYPAASGLGCVARPGRVDTALLEHLADGGWLTVLAPIAALGGEHYNVNADDVAAAVAGALRADELIMLTDVAGIWESGGGELRFLERATADRLRELLESGEIAGGMRPKVLAALQALSLGAHRARIIDGRTEHALVRAIDDPHLGTELLGEVAEA